MFFDPLTAWVVSLFTTGIPLAKEKIEQVFEPTIPAENWANKDLYHKDLMSGMSVEERMKNVKNGRYSSDVFLFSLRFITGLIIPTR